MPTEAEAWDGFRTRLGAYVRRRVDPAWADDVVGEVMVRLVRRRADLEGAANPTAWVLRVAANTVADHHRRRASEARALAAVQAEAAPLVAGPSAPDGAGQELAACLEPFIRSLPDRYGTALRLTELDGLTQADAARRLGLTLSGMKSRVQRGRKMLKQALLRCCVIERDRRGGVVDYTRRRTGCGAAC